MSGLVAELERRLRDALQRLAQGDDLPPSHQLRLEGLCEAAVLAGLATPEELDARFIALHREIRGTDPGAPGGGDWRNDHPFPELPLFARRAPVSPSTPR